MQLYYGSSSLKKVFYGDTPVNKIYRGNNLVYIRDVVFTITPNPSDANVVLTATGYTQVGNTITVPYGTNVTYQVSKSGYATVTNTIPATSETPILVNITQQHTFTITPTPSNASVVLTASGFTQVGNSIVVDHDTVVDYTVSKTGYVTQQNSVTVSSDQNLAIQLALENYTLTINPYPSDATVSFNTGTVSGNTCTAPYGTTITYTVSRSDYETVNDSITLTSNLTVNVNLRYRPYTPGQIVFNSSTPGNYSTTLLADGNYSVVYSGGGGSGSSVACRTDSAFTVKDRSQSSGTNAQKLTATINVPVGQQYTVTGVIGGGAAGSSTCSRSSYDSRSAGTPGSGYQSGTAGTTAKYNHNPVLAAGSGGGSTSLVVNNSLIGTAAGGNGGSASIKYNQTGTSTTVSWKTLSVTGGTGGSGGASGNGSAGGAASYGAGSGSSNTSGAGTNGYVTITFNSYAQ